MSYSFSQESSFSQDRFDKIPIIGILRNIPPEHIENLAKLYMQSGLTTLEVTMNSGNAPETIAHLVKNFGQQLNIGAGTVCSTADLQVALTAGAQFIVTPIIDEEVIKTCVAEQIPIFPGAYTPTEIYKAWSLGASMVKVFPATKLGPEFIKDVLAPLNKVKLLPTGGISLHNFTEFLRAGAKGVGIGSEIFPKNLIQNQEWDLLGTLFADFARQYKAL
jgi:2-dehydro-3-deoxyphosphogluconate aldolase/(4S)-4-hydroxy-2-oxoglutarate aldolase